MILILKDMERKRQSSLILDYITIFPFLSCAPLITKCTNSSGFCSHKANHLKRIKPSFWQQYTSQVCLAGIKFSSFHIFQSPTLPFHWVNHCDSLPIPPSVYCLAPWVIFFKDCVLWPYPTFPRWPPWLLISWIITNL